MGSIALSAAVLLSPVQRAHAVTPEQLLFLEVTYGHVMRILQFSVSTAAYVPKSEEVQVEGWSSKILWHLRHVVICLLQAWRAVDRAYVDKSFNGQSWFKVSRRSPKVLKSPVLQ